MAFGAGILARRHVAIGGRRRGGHVASDDPVTPDVRTGVKARERGGAVWWADKCETERRQ